jgi:hypothetical protein
LQLPGSAGHEVLVRNSGDWQAVCTR